MKCDEIFVALSMLEKERGIPQDFMMEKIVQALTTAYKKDHPGVENVYVDVNQAKKELKMYVQKEVVEEVESPGSQISLADARSIRPAVNIGDTVNIPVDNVEFGRIAAGNGKQVIIQGLREAERGMVYDEFRSSPEQSPARIPAMETCPCVSVQATSLPRQCCSRVNRSPARSWWRDRRSKSTWWRSVGRPGVPRC